MSNNREFLMLAQKYLPKHHVGGWLMSEKLDGRRMFWDGGITRGMAKSVIPWANTAKDERLKKVQISTGLWSRYGNVIHAPDWWMNKLPRIPLDGEAWSRGMPRQDIMSITAKHEPDSGWYDIGFQCFDMPAYESVFADGRINNPNYKKQFHNIMTWINERGLLGEGSLDYRPKPSTPFESRYWLLQKWLKGVECPVVFPHKQVQLPYSTDAAAQMLEQETQRIVSRGGEGMVVRSAGGLWVPKRVGSALKVKPLDDDEGIVTGYTTGRVGKEGKHLGRMGALILEYHGFRLELAGFKDVERPLKVKDREGVYRDGLAPIWAKDNPGEDVPDWVHNPKFPRGSQVTFKYRGKSKDGVPQEARYWRRRNDQ